MSLNRGASVGSRLLKSPSARTFAGIGAAGAYSARVHEVDDEPRQKARATNLTLGALGGQAAYQTAGWADNLQAGPAKRRHYADPVHRTGDYRWKPVPQSALEGPDKKRRRAYEQLRREHRERFPRKADQYRNLPKELGGTKVDHVFGHTHGGRTGMAVNAGVTGLGALIVHRARSRNEVGKSVAYGYRERTLSVPRTGEALAGGALAAYGVSRMRLGGMASYGARLAAKHGGGKEADEALALARELRDSVRRQTGKGERQLRKVAALDRAIERVPANLRPAVATSVGAVLVSNARPVHNERFRPL